jgi:acyl dehydratase
MMTTRSPRDGLNRVTSRPQDPSDPKDGSTSDARPESQARDDHALSPKYAEDLQTGKTFDLGVYTPTEAEIVTFATAWDPLDIHIDAHAARHSRFGGLIASGVHTLAIFQRLAVIGDYKHWAVVAGRRIGSIELTSPVHPGTPVHGTVSIVEVQYTHDDRALVVQRGQLNDDRDGTVIMTVAVEAYVARRPQD